MRNDPTARVRQKLFADMDATMRLYALVDFAADDRIFDQLRHPDIHKENLFAGENAWTMEQVAPYLLHADTQDAVLDFLLQSGWGNHWGIFFTSDADLKTLLAHLRNYLYVPGARGRNVFFRYYDPRILRDYLPLLSEEESACFFGPIKRFIVEDHAGRPLEFVRPGGVAATGKPWPVLGPEKQKTLSASWKKRSLKEQARAYRNLGLAVSENAQDLAMTISDAAGTKATLRHTDSGVAVTTGEGRTFYYELTKCGNPSRVIDPDGQTVCFDVQERENLVQSIRMPARRTWVFEYDRMDHLARIDYPDSTHVGMEHDSYGNLAGETDRNGNTTRFERDSHERLTVFQDVNGRQTEFSYQDLTAPSQIQFADGKVFNFEYTDKGALKKFLAANTRVAEYQEDPQTSNWHVRYADGSRAEFVFENDKIVRAVNEAGTVELAYDDAGRLICESFHNQRVVYERNETGHLTGIVTPQGRRVGFERDAEQRVQKITDWFGRSMDIRYAPGGVLAGIDYPNGTRLSQKSTPSGLAEKITLTSSHDPQPLLEKTYKRDLLDRVVAVSDPHRSVSYSYDREGRLLAASSEDPTLNEFFKIDAKANRLADRRTAYRINAADRMEQIEPIRSNPLKLAHDALGNMVQGTCPLGAVSCTFAAGNRLKQLNVNGTAARYSYDAFGRRVEKRTGGRRTRFIWAGAQLLQQVEFMDPNPGFYRTKAEYYQASRDGYDNLPVEDDDAVLTDFLFFPGTPVLLALCRNHQQTHWAAFGHRYEVLCLTDANGAVAWQAEYDAFGNAHIEKGHFEFQPFRLAGQYLDEESGLHYAAARYYDPQCGRYLSLDPLFLEGGATNFYVYCNGDPINRIDPTGEFIILPILIGAAIGAAVGGYLEHRRQKQAGEATDGFKVAGAALLGGAIGALGGAVAAVIETAAATAMAGTALSSSTFAGMGAIGFLSSAGSSIAEQCSLATANGNGIDPMHMTRQALTDGVIGAGLAMTGFGACSFAARRLKKIHTVFQADLPVEIPNQLTASVDNARPVSQPVAQKARRQSGRSDQFCKADPVDPITGQVVLTQTDFTLPGRIPLAWTRRYASHSHGTGLLGDNWQTPADMRLELDPDGIVTFCDTSAKAAVFEKLPEDGPVREAADGAMLRATQQHLLVELKSGLTCHFNKQFAGDGSYVVQISDASGNYLRFIRQDGDLIRIVDNSGRVIEVTSEHGRILQMDYKEKPLVRYVYRAGELTAAMDPLGHAKRFEYQNGLLTRHTNKNKLSFHYRYDPNGRCIHTWGDHGLYDYRFEYSGFERRTQVTDSRGHSQQFFYDADKLPIRVQDPTGAETRYTYDKVGRVIRVTDALGRSTQYDYDSAGNLLQIIQPDDNFSAFAYENNRPVQIQDPNGKISQYRFNQQGQLIEKAGPLGGCTRYRYNHRGDLTAVTDPEGHVTCFEWDDHGLLKSVADPDGNRTHYQRDLLGNITAVIDPAGRQSRYLYDPKSRLVETVQPSGAGQKLDYDPEDNLVRHIDPNGHESRFEYTGVNEIGRRINADGTTVTYRYDSEENLVSLTNGKGQSYRFEYDPAGRVIRQTDYYGATSTFGYDPAGRLIQSTDPLQRVITYAYDPAGRLRSKTFESEEQENFSWDANGNLVAFQSADALVQRFFDAENNLVAEKTGDFVVHYAHDKNGRRTQRTTSHGNSVTYSHNPAGAVSAIQINDQQPVEIQRDATGRIETERFGNYLERRFEYSQDGLLTRQQINGSGAQFQRRYTYDPAGNLITRHDSTKGDWHFTYDPMGRIIQAVDPLVQVKYHSYDPAGNMSQRHIFVAYSEFNRDQKNLHDFRVLIFENEEQICISFSPNLEAGERILRGRTSFGRGCELLCFKNK